MLVFFANLMSSAGEKPVTRGARRLRKEDRRARLAKREQIERAKKEPPESNRSF